MSSEVHYLYGGPIHTSMALTVVEEDWSQVRSRSRAIRRRRLGHRQNVRFVERPDPKVYMINGSFYMHPATLSAVERGLDHGGLPR